MIINFDGSPAFLRFIHNATPDGRVGDSSQGAIHFSCGEFTATTLNGRANCKYFLPELSREMLQARGKSSLQCNELIRLFSLLGCRHIIVK